VEKSKHTPIALTIAGSDPCGGAGLQADSKTFAALGVYGASAITAVTVQDTRGVRAVHALAPELVTAQIQAVLDDLDVAAVKIGMLANAEVARAVAGALRGDAPIVLDPVLRSSGGHELLSRDGLAVLRAELLPRATLITPNVAEAAALLERAEADVLSDPTAACRDLLALGPAAVVLTGGHRPGPICEDLHFDGLALESLPAQRVETCNSHGTGCTFSAAIAAFLARGDERARSVRAAKRYVTAALIAADELKVGRGPGPLNHFHRERGSAPG